MCLHTQSVRVTMAKHPSCFKLQSPLREANAAVASEAVTLYDGPVRSDLVRKLSDLDI